MDGRNSSTSTFCQECNETVECSLDEHRYARKHINRLLQLGLQLPLDFVSHTEEEPLPEESKVGYCITCDISVGTPLQAAVHYRSREHINRRLQRGLPIAELPPEPTQSSSSSDRDHINECLRRGIAVEQPLPAQPIRQMNSNTPPSAAVPRGPSNGKRKFPTGYPYIYSPASGSIPGHTGLAPQLPNFTHEKRPCRPAGPTSILKLRPNYGVKTFTAHGSSFSEPQMPQRASRFSAARTQGRPYQTPSPRMHAATAFGGQNFQAVPRISPKVEYNWNSSPSGANFKDFSMAYSQPAMAGVVETWHCEVCNMELPNASSWQLHISSHHMKLATPGTYVLQ